MDIKKITFDTCPNCGSKNRFFANVSAMAREYSTASEKYNLCYAANSNVAGEPKLVEAAKIGSELPAYSIALDVCEDCGTVYAIEMRTFTVQKASNPAPPRRIPPIVVPGGRFPNPPGGNNPFTS